MKANPQIVGLELLATAAPYYGLFLDIYGTIDPQDGHYIDAVALTGTTGDISELLNAIPGQLDRMEMDLDRKAYGVMAALKIEAALDRGQYLAESVAA